MEKVNLAWCWLQGRKTIWAARFYTITGFLLFLHDQIIAAGFNIQPYLPVGWTGAKWFPWAVMGTGVLFEFLRRITPARYENLGDEEPDF
jgi:hypothetical protein